MTLTDRILELIEGPKIAAVATVNEESGQILPAVRYMVTTGLGDLTLMAATNKSTRKIKQIKKNQNVALTIRKEGDFSNPYVIIRAQAEIHDDLVSKRSFWNPSLEKRFDGPEDPNYVVLKYTPSIIEYYHEGKVDVWRS